MTEPTYVYRKGEGWVTQPTTDYRIATLKSGETVRLEHREPISGQDLFYDSALLNTTWFDSEGNPKWDNWVSAYAHMYLKELVGIHLKPNAYTSAAQGLMTITVITT